MEGLFLLNNEIPSKDLIIHYGWNLVIRWRADPEFWHVVVGSMQKPLKLAFSTRTGDLITKFCDSCVQMIYEEMQGQKKEEKTVKERIQQARRERASVAMRSGRMSSTRISRASVVSANFNFEKK